MKLYDYRITYVQKPNWLIMLVGIVKGYLSDDETFDSFTSKFEEVLDETIIVTRNTKSSAKDLITKLCYDTKTFTIYNQNNSIICIIEFLTENE